MRPPAAHRPPPRHGLLTGVLLLTLMLTGCGGGGVTAEQVAKIVAALSASAAFADRKRKAGTSFSHYLERRVAYLTGKNGGWANESGFPSLTARIGTEMDALAAFIDTTVAALSPDNKVPAHRDLDDAAKRHVSDGPSVVSTNAAKFRFDRKQRVAQIAWRAGAVQDGVWGGGDSTLAPTLQQAPLLELVDRRLRAVEIMMLHDGTGPSGGWTVAAVAAGWKDGQRASMFEYPWVDEFDGSGTPIFANALGAAGLTIAGLADWREEPAEKRVYFRPRMTRWRAAAAADWSVSDNPYVLTYVGGGPVSAALERVIPAPATMDAAFEDFWERSWMYCDMMLAFMHVEALRFGRKRRTGSDAEFDGAAGAGVTLRPLIPRVTPPDPAALMTRGADWFDGVAIQKDEVQVGDHLILWNSAFVRNMLWSAFGLENSIVTRVMPNGHTLMLAGHGEPEFAEGHFLDELASEIKSAFEGLRRKVEQAVGIQADVASFHMTRLNISFHIVRWAPFNEDFKRSSTASLQVDGAWWVRIKRTQLQDQGEPVPTMALALARVPKSIRVVPGMQAPPLQAGDHDADFQESIYLPLSVPRGVQGGWGTYLGAHKGAGETVTLDDLIPDGTMVPGFFSDGPATKIPVFRPKLKP